MTNRKLEKKVEQMKSWGISDTYKIFLKLSNRKVSKKRYTDFYNQSFSTLLKNGTLPVLERYPLNNWIIANRNKYHFVYATGGQRLETRYVLKNLGLLKYFDLKNSVDKTTGRFSKNTGIPFKKIKSKFKDCILVSDSETDCKGATLAKVPFILVNPKQDYLDL